MFHGSLAGVTSVTLGDTYLQSRTVHSFIHSTGFGGGQACQMQGDRHFLCALSYSYPRRQNCDAQTATTAAWRMANSTITLIKRISVFGRITFKKLSVRCWIIGIWNVVNNSSTFQLAKSFVKQHKYFSSKENKSMCLVKIPRFSYLHENVYLYTFILYFIYIFITPIHSTNTNQDVIIHQMLLGTGLFQVNQEFHWLLYHHIAFY